MPLFYFSFSFLLSFLLSFLVIKLHHKRIGICLCTYALVKLPLVWGIVIVFLQKHMTTDGSKQLNFIVTQNQVNQEKIVMTDLHLCCGTRIHLGSLVSYQSR